MECNNCGNAHAYAIRIGKDKQLGWLESCNLCGGVSGSSAYVPDVYWNGPGYMSTLVDKHNKPIFLESRRHKAQVMKEQNAREAGDLYHGSRGTEVAHIRPTEVKRPNENVLKLKKMFQEHQRVI